MKKIIQSILIVLFYTLTLQKIAAQHYVNIPDANFASYLQTNFTSCMNGSQLDTICASQVSATTIDVTNLGITNLTGIQYFKTITTLDFGANAISLLPAFPNSLTLIECDNSSLTSLPALPTSLVTLQCANNKLTALPTLPSTLNYLRCELNQLNSLPTLPASLAYLVCTDNQLQCLPVLPEGLSNLYAVRNHVACIPNMPSGLTADSAYPVCGPGNPNPNGCNVLNVTAITGATMRNSLQVFPNPSTGLVTINCAYTATGLTIAGMDGKVVYETSVSNSNYNIDLSGIVKGIYVAQVTNVNGVITQKVVFE